jgi:DNA-binding MarR family transcriptional regulator
MAALGRFAPLTASDVGQRIIMDKVAVSRAVASLMKRGLVERAADLDDRRRASLRLTTKGRAMHAKIVPIALEYEARLCHVLSPAERETLNGLCDRLFAHAKLLRNPA